MLHRNPLPQPDRIAPEMPRDLLPIVRAALAGKYTVEGEIGKGGAARVFRATNTTGEPVALKVLRPELVVTVTADRFLREIQIVQRLEHPRIGRLIDSGQSDWLVYYAMPFIDGPSLQQILQRRGRLSPTDTLRIGRDLLSALGHAHQRSIVHRDVKPDNILIDGEGAVLVDFGIARAIELAGTDRVTKSGMAVGTSRYMSPEQIAGSETVDPRSDLYSLACVLFECLAGRPPYHHPTETAILELHRTAPVPDIRTFAPAVPAELATAVSKALGKTPEERWPTAAAMLQAMG
jgi:eukaryotic-like serine/threonine-protein kinase